METDAAGTSQSPNAADLNDPPETQVSERKQETQTTPLPGASSSTISPDRTHPITPTVHVQTPPPPDTSPQGTSPPDTSPQGTPPLVISPPSTSRSTTSPLIISLPSTSRSTTSPLVTSLPSTSRSQSKAGQKPKWDPVTDVFNILGIRDERDRGELPLSKNESIASSSSTASLRPKRWFHWFQLPKQTPVILFVYFYAHLLSLFLLAITTSTQLQYEITMTIVFQYVLHFVGIGCCVFAIHGFIEKWPLWFFPLQLYLMHLELSLVVALFLIVMCNKDTMLDAYQTIPYYNMKLTEYVPEIVLDTGKEIRIESEPMNEVAIQCFRACFIIASVILINGYVIFATARGYGEKTAAPGVLQNIEMTELGEQRSQAALDVPQDIEKVELGQQ